MVRPAYDHTPMIAPAARFPTMWQPAFTAPQSIGLGFVDSNVAVTHRDRKGEADRHDDAEHQPFTERVGAGRRGQHADGDRRQQAADKGMA